MTPAEQLVIGSPCAYRVPSASGWRQLTGRIVRVHPCGVLLVREARSGVEATINLDWLVSYIFMMGTH